MLYFAINMDARGEYYWMLIDENDHIIGKSINSYKEFKYCENRIKAIMVEWPYADIEHGDLIHHSNMKRI